MDRKTIYNGPFLGGKLTIVTAPDLGNNMLFWQYESLDNYQEGHAEVDLIKYPNIATVTDALKVHIQSSILEVVMRDKAECVRNGASIH